MRVMSTTRAERAAVTRGKLLDAAVQLFQDKPYGEVSVHDLADAAGVAYGLVAHHFGNKRGIHLEAMRQIARILVPDSPPLGRPEVRIRHFIRDQLAAIQQNPSAYLGLMLSADPDSRVIIDSAVQLAVQTTSEILGLDPERPALRLVLRSWLGSFNEAAVAWVQDGYPFPAEEMVEVVAATLAELLHQAARLDSTLEPAPALLSLNRSASGPGTAQTPQPS
jgi:AcrR family transcriptional regulator